VPRIPQQSVPAGPWMHSQVPQSQCKQAFEVSKKKKSVHYRAAF
jgi:hypothetical protein